MKLVWSSQAWKDYLHWQKTDRKVLARINDLIKAIVRTPFEGIGKPESLKGDLKGYWSRRINTNHRLVYKSDSDSIYIASCRYHYSK